MPVRLSPVLADPAENAASCFHASNGSPGMTMKDYAIVSLHEKGFWQVDVYWKKMRSGSTMTEKRCAWIA